MDDDVRKILTPTRYYVKSNLKLISNETRDIVRKYGEIWAKKSRISLMCDHWVPKSSIISARNVLGILLVVKSEDYSKQANVFLSIENVSKKTHAGKLLKVSYVHSKNEILETRTRFKTVLAEFGLLNLFQNGLIPWCADGALYGMFKSDPVINSMVSKCVEHGFSNCSKSFFEESLRNLRISGAGCIEAFDKFKKFVSSANLTEKRKNPECCPNLNDFIKSNKHPEKNDKYAVGKLMFANWAEQSEPEFKGRSIFEQKMLTFYESY